MNRRDMAEIELRDFLNKEENLSNQDKFKTLMAIFDKHFAMEKVEHQMDIGDMRQIVDYAKGSYIQTQLPMKISKKEVYSTEVPHVLMIEAVISHLNRHELLRKLVKFDYTK